MKQLLTIVTIFLASALGSAQIHILENGHVIVGKVVAEPNENGLVLLDKLTPDYSAAMTIDGKGYKHSGGKISFGNIRNATIGTETNDVLTFFGARGLEYRFEGGTVFRYYNTNPYLLARDPTPFTFECPLKATQIFTSSDMNQKREITNLEGAGSMLEQITPVSYKLSLPQSCYSSTGDENSEKNFNTAARQSERVQFGFLAQEIAEVYPELVATDEEGNMAVDYQGFVPLLVDALKDVHRQLEEQAKTIEVLATLAGIRPDDLNRLSSEREKSTIGINSVSPNPVVGVCSVELEVPSGVVYAYLDIASTDGLHYERIDITERGRFTISIDASQLNNGIYICRLVADSEESEPKRIIVAH